jgi:uncharacterized protein YbjQ (UPF0145 family)
MADDDAAARAEASLRSIEAGGLPLPAQERLRRLREGGARFFTSDLSANELLLVREGGFRPLTQVMGSCFYHVGYQWLPMSQTGFGAWTTGRWQEGQTVELETQSEAWNEARGLALGRLQEEARLAGADAVVGVRLERGRYEWATGLIEIVATGTAVRSERYDLGDEPMLSNLSGQEFAALVRHGWWPAGIVAGSTVCYVMTGWQQQSRATGWFSSYQNQELPDFTSGLYDARSRAMLRVTREAHETHAHGVVGVSFQQHVHEYERDQNNVKYTDLIVELHVLGTAVVERADGREQPPVYIALPLNEETR